jgi:hypothetical protein
MPHGAYGATGSLVGWIRSGLASWWSSVSPPVPTQPDPGPGYPPPGRPPVTQPKRMGRIGLRMPHGASTRDGGGGVLRSNSPISGRCPDAHRGRDPFPAGHARAMRQATLGRIHLGPPLGGLGGSPSSTQDLPRSIERHRRPPLIRGGSCANECMGLRIIVRLSLACAVAGDQPDVDHHELGRS